MHPNNWPVDRLLVCCKESQAPHALSPALHALRRNLPETDITVLIFGSNHPVQLEAPTIQVTFIPTWIDEGTVAWIRQRSFDAAIILTSPVQSPYAMAYLCYLAGIPIRVGQSNEFGGGVLSSCVMPPLEDVSPPEYHIHLLRSLGFSIDVETEPSAAVKFDIPA